MNVVEEKGLPGFKTGPEVAQCWCGPQIVHRGLTLGAHSQPKLGKLGRHQLHHPTKAMYCKAM